MVYTPNDSVPTTKVNPGRRRVDRSLHRTRLGPDTDECTCRRVGPGPRSFPPSKSELGSFGRRRVGSE